MVNASFLFSLVMKISIPYYYYYYYNEKMAEINVRAPAFGREKDK